ncbi:hypothetical protein QJS10_CPA10g01485 [Acorus calamus]|uniref:Endonuclease/exonuclease/phosphatase domain-containing protein n=1 Tax=Acorus calamus TaxID=4465 RepID=A0AAV9DYJ0_ACOCL|nr:hypothetical protein QJS10_CPA10g01485 [Acorus calamus]
MVSISAESFQFCHCEVVQLKDGTRIDITAVYASNSPADRLVLWENLESLKQSSDSVNWIVGRDFNEVWFANEKIGGCRPKMKQLQRFNNALQACALQDIKSTGHYLSWSNRQDKRISCRLDQILGNHNGILSYPESYIHYLPEGISDHSPLLVHQSPVVAFDPKPFKFFHMWTLHPGFLDLVSQSWNVPIVGSPLFILAQKLKRLKMTLKNWNAQCFSPVHRRIQETRLRLETTQSLLQRDPNNLHLIQQERMDRILYEETLTQEESFIRQKSRQMWLQLGDRNSKFFYASISGRKASNTLRKVTCSDGSTLFESADVEHETIQYHSALLNKEN